MSFYTCDEQVERPIPDSYWVLRGRLLAGEYPRAKDDASSGPKLRRILGAGVTFFLDLTEEGEHGLKAYVPMLQAEAGAMARAVTHRRLSIPDQGIPSTTHMTHILNVLDEALAEREVAYVHCYGGIGRTGTVVGCYLVRHGMSGAGALAEIARLREGTPDGW